MVLEKQVEDVLGNLTEKDFKRIKKLSASKIYLWRHCPMAFFQRYIVHEKIPEHIRLTFGKSIHYYLDMFYDKNFKSPDSFANAWSWYWRGNVSAEVINKKKSGTVNVRRYPSFRRVPFDPKNPTEEEGFIEIGDHMTFGHYIDDTSTYLLDGRDKPQRHPKVNIAYGYTSLGKSIMKRFHKRHKDKEPPLYRETRKTLDLFGHEVIVIFDRIDKWPSGEWTITDYKTNKWPPRGLDFHKNVQFTIYSYAARKLFGEELGPKEKAIYHYHLRTGELHETHRGEDDFVYLEKLLEDTSDGINRALRTGNFIPHYGHQCPSCDFAIPCDKYSPHHGGPKIIMPEELHSPRSFETWEELEEAHNPIIEVA